jgi:GT2 family glycosyltransferase
MTTVRIAVLMTAHNRKPKTLGSLAALYDQRLEPGVELDVFLVDDGSSDGTSEAVAARFPAVRLVRGSGDLYWVGGMRAAYVAAAASHTEYEYHLWLNDDTVLYPTAIEMLLATARALDRSGYPNALITGATQDPGTRAQVSGGFYFKWHPIFMRFELVEPSDEPVRCDTTAGNALLIPRQVFQTLGNLSADYVHIVGDFDYGLRAIEHGFTIWTPAGYLGETPDDHPSRNEIYELPRLRDVFRQLRQPKGLNYGSNFQQRFVPAKEWVRFLRRFRALGWPVAWVLTYRKLIGLIAGRWVYRGRKSVSSLMSRLRGSAQ